MPLYAMHSVRPSVRPSVSLSILQELETESESFYNYMTAVTRNKIS